MRSVLLTAAAISALLAACSPTTAPAEQASKAEIGSFGIDTAAIDASVKPGDDFYTYVNGKWLADFAIPADKARYGVFDELSDRAETNLRTIVDELAASSPASGTNEQKVADLFASWMDEAALETRGVSPLKPKLDQISAIASRSDLMKLTGDIFLTFPISAGVETDPSDTSRYAVWIGQDGLGMPNRDYYLKSGERFDQYRAAYTAYLTRIFEVIGNPDPAAAAKQVLTLERKIAEIHWAPERQRNVKEAVNQMSLAELKTLAPSVNWESMLADLGLPGTERVVVQETTAIADGGKLMQSEPLDSWKNYLAFHYVNDNASYLTKAVDDANFEFYSRTLRGVETQRDRWKRGVGLLDRLMGEALGQIYVARHFPADHKAKMDELVANLRTGLETRLQTLEWMDDATRQEALKKLSTFEPRVGYPNKWRDYSALSIEAGKLFENVAAARRFEWNRNVSRINSPVDREEWGMNPQTVNAYYNPLMNQITFPAAILQPPFFDPAADPAVNYGAIGAVIGHEIGHGFDDQGREFDETGKIRNWWSEQTNANFLASTDRLAALFDSYCPLADGCVNGRLTMGENIGDLGGLQMAYEAYRLSLKGAEAPVIDGFTGDQRFFMAWAQAWKAKQREDALRNQLLTDPHSPAMVRGAAPLRNIDAWYEAFGVQEGDKMYLPPDQRVRIW